MKMISLKWSVRQIGMLKPLKSFKEVPKAGLEISQYGIAATVTAQMEGDWVTQLQRLGTGLMGTQYNLKLALKQVFEYYGCTSFHDLKNVKKSISQKFPFSYIFQWLRFVLLHVSVQKANMS